AQDNEFWFVAPDVLHNHGDRPVMFVFSNPDPLNPVEVTLQLKAAGTTVPSVTVTVPAGGAQVVSSAGPIDIDDVENPIASSGTPTDFGIHITTDGGKILAYYMVAHEYQRDLFALKGKQALGTDFYTPFQGITQDFPQGTGAVSDLAHSQIDIVATENNTWVKITLPSGAACYDGSLYTLSGTIYKELAKGKAVKFAIKSQNTSGPHPLSGTRIESVTANGSSTQAPDRPIAVTITEDCIQPLVHTSTDMAGDQLVPVTMTGSRYVLIRGQANDTSQINIYAGNMPERIDFTATQPGTDITVYYKGISPLYSGTLNAGQTWSVDINATATPLIIYPDTAIFVQASAPVYCYQHSANNGELGAAIIPSMYSISQHQISFYASDLPNSIFLVYRKDEIDSVLTKFEIDFGSGYNPLTSATAGVSSFHVGDIPFPTGNFEATDWRYIKVRFTAGIINTMISIRNNYTPFSLGYFSGDVEHSTSYGYLSAFSGFEFDLDSIWRCRPDPGHSCEYWNGTAYVPCNAAYRDNKLHVNVLADTVYWTLPTSNTVVKKSYREYDLDYHAYDLDIPDTESGKYHVLISQDGNEIETDIHVFNMTFGTEIARLPKKPAKVTVPQKFHANIRGLYDDSMLPQKVTYQWDADGGDVISEDMENITVVWNSTGVKRLTLSLQASGRGWTGDTVRCDTTCVYPVLVHEKHLGFFVDQDVNPTRVHDGKNWTTAFPTLQQALALASQGDYIWVADGEYSPHDNLPAGNFAKVYTGHYMLDYDSLTVFTDSYVMDWDSVRVYGGFEGTERNLNERDFVAHPTILSGSGNSVIVIQGSTPATTPYTNGLWGITRGARWDGFTIQHGEAFNGGGIRFEGGASAILSNNVLRNNTASHSGGGIYFSGPYTGPVPGDEPLLHHLEISGNRAAYGAGIYNDGANLTLLHATLGGNLAANDAGGFYNVTGQPQILNSIIWGNRAASGGNVVNENGNPYYSHSNIGDSRSGEVWDDRLGHDGGNNTDSNPAFYLNGFDDYGNLQQGDYRLRYPTPSTESGQSSYLFLDNYPVSVLLRSPLPQNTVYRNSYIDRDLEGKERIIYDYVDMGAYEYIEAPVGRPVMMREIIVPTQEGVLSNPPPGVYYVESRRNFSVTLSPQEGYTLDFLRVFTGARTQDEEGSMETVYNADGSLTVTFHSVIEPLKVWYMNVFFTGNGSIDAAPVLWSDAGTLYIQTSQAVAVKIYTLTGQVYKQQKVVGGGKTAIPLPPGMYIVTLNDGLRQKVIIR
ncbi:MAG: T9SS type A sorting domain-containing protein, partial [Tannerella sp.]|nr:T9SS type A sorting domain-containing protein [Tannerella sp.]